MGKPNKKFAILFDSNHKGIYMEYPLTSMGQVVCDAKYSTLYLCRQRIKHSLEETLMSLFAKQNLHNISIHCRNRTTRNLIPLLKLLIIKVELVTWSNRNNNITINTINGQVRSKLDNLRTTKTVRILGLITLISWVCTNLISHTLAGRTLVCSTLDYANGFNLLLTTNLRGFW